MDALISLPPALSTYLKPPARQKEWATRLAVPPIDRFFFGNDPAGRRLGSGGGTVHLLHAAWRAQTRGRLPLAEWLQQTQRLILHAGGESRRLPAYAAIGKAFMPLPDLPGVTAPRHDLRVCDIQLPRYGETLARAGSRARILVTSGDVWLDFRTGDLPTVSADIVGLGMRVPPEVACHFGVFFTARAGSPLPTDAEHPIAFFLQKPRPEEIRRHAATYDFYVDTGMWLLSAEAVAVLFRACGWDETRRRFSQTPDLDEAAPLDLYTEVGTLLGDHAPRPPARLHAAGFQRLRSAVIPLDRARFLHFGTNRQLLDALVELSGGGLSPRRHFIIGSAPTRFDAPPQAPVWVEGCCPTHPLRLEGSALVCGLPEEASIFHIPADYGVETLPLRDGLWALRFWHLDDSLRGHPARGGRIAGQPADLWLHTHGFNAPQANDADVFDLKILPVVPACNLTQELLDWCLAPGQPGPRPAGIRRFVSARELPDLADFAELFARRRKSLLNSLNAELDRADATFAGRDLAALSADLASLPATARKSWQARALTAAEKTTEIVPAARLAALAARLTSSPAEAKRLREAAFARLGSAVLQAVGIEPARPIHKLKEDQIVWARSPVRLDLAGGWTDTPPACFEHGGAVLNLAVLLNGQPPIQVFVRRIPEPLLRLRSIDLGLDCELRTHADLAAYTDPRSGFSLPRAALALAGLEPRFLAGPVPASLRSHLQALGGGLELSLLCAVPKGSGLGTSSILGATLLGALNRALGLGWDEIAIYRRVLAMEQLLTTGGGWQDQAGALYPGLKLIATSPGPAQTPVVSYLPEHLAREAFASGRWLLYYTGITRLAKGILRDIVNGMFLGDRRTLLTLDEIRTNAHVLHSAFQRADFDAVHRCVARSWTLNRRLDAGTCTPEIARLLALIEPRLAATKLLGAGGGGYLLLCARSEADAREIRALLEKNPPNARARFVDCTVAEQGLEVTVS